MEIWHTDVEGLTDEKARALLAQLPAHMVQEISGYREPADRKCRIAARLMVKEYYLQNGFPGHWHEWRRNNAGKPYFPDGPFFNMAHSGNRAVVAFDKETEIGLDIERLQDFDVNEILPFLHPEEIRFLNKTNNDVQAIYTLWVRKEALLKATGKGLFDKMAQISVLKNALFCEKQWNIRSIEIAANYKCAVCFQGSGAHSIVQKFF